MSNEILDLDDSWRGKYVRRVRASTGRALTKPHLVESVINGGPVTNCGHQMRRGTGYPFREEMTDFSDACLLCPLPAVTYPAVLNDDDGSTWTETVP